MTVNVKWLAEDRYIPKLGVYRKGDTKPMPEKLAKVLSGTGECEIVKQTKTKTKGE